MKRLEKFYSFKTHAWLGRSFKKLSHADIEFCRDYIMTNTSLTDDEYAKKAVRLFIDNPSKPKAWKEIEELLICSL